MAPQSGVRVAGQNPPMPPSRHAAATDQTPQGRLDEGPIHDLLGYQLAQAAIVTSAAFARTVGRPLGLRPVAFTLLQLIGENQAVTPARLAKALAIKAPAITVWLDKLSGQGLLTRLPHAADGRSHKLRLTPEGEQLLRTAREQLLLEDDRLLAALSADERTQLLALLRKVAALRAKS
jgi:DNA-binding MarR family transcriptional regulator